MTTPHANTPPRKPVFLALSMREDECWESGLFATVDEANQWAGEQVDVGNYPVYICRVLEVQKAELVREPK